MQRWGELERISSKDEHRTEAIMLRIIVERSTDTAILRCAGRIVTGKEVDTLKNALVCQADKRVVLLDLAGVEAIDAAGLGLLVFLQNLAYAAGFELQVTNPTRRVRELLELTRLDLVLAITSEEAPAHFGQNAAGMTA